MATEIIGRKYEKSKLEKVFKSNEAEFVAIYGRRRVGKTFLIKNFFTHKECMFFQVSGILNAKASLQLSEFKKAIEDTFYSQFKATTLSTPSTWMEALEMLNEAIVNFAHDKKVVLFFDEFPWMAIRKFKLLQALDYYWNRYWSNMPNVKLIICGSAASWIIENILNNKGGLHNRVTLKLPIEPFKLNETKAYLKSRGVNYSNAQILQLYMCVGGIPHYLKLVEKGLSAIQNVNNMCFQKKGTLLDEFDNLFSSLFSNSEICEKIIRLVASKREGVSREEIEASLKVKGGRLTLRLKELIEAGFITMFTPWNRERGAYYKIIDEYTLFYLSWIKPQAKARITREFNAKYWEEMAQTPAWKSWAGYAYESICFKHIGNICSALNIPEGAAASSWKYVAKKGDLIDGAQIDLLFDRNDGIINLCEIKYSKQPFNIDKDYARDLENKAYVYKRITQTNKQIFISLITSAGLKESKYSKDLISSMATAGDLFND